MLLRCGTASDRCAGDPRRGWIHGRGMPANAWVEDCGLATGTRAFHCRGRAAHEPVGFHHPRERHGGPARARALARQRLLVSVAVWCRTACARRHTRRSVAWGAGVGARRACVEGGWTARGDFPRGHTRAATAVEERVLPAGDGDEIARGAGRVGFRGARGALGKRGHHHRRCAEGYGRIAPLLRAQHGVQP